MCIRDRRPSAFSRPDRLLDTLGGSRNAVGGFLHLRVDAGLLIPFGQYRLVGVAVGLRGNRGGDEIHVVVLGHLVTGHRERLLEDEAIFVVGVGVTAEAEVAEAVDNVAALIHLPALHHVRCLLYTSRCV